MNKMLYLILFGLSAANLVAMEREGALPPELRSIVIEFAASSAAAHKVPEKYIALRTLLQSKKFSPYTSAVIDHIAKVNPGTNPWYVAVQLGTPPALEWIKQHAPKNEEDWNNVRDAFNAAISLEKSNFIDALAKLDTDWGKAQR